MNKQKKELSIIIVNYNTKKLTQECIAAIQKNTKGIIYEIIVVDNASTDGSAKALKKQKDIKFIQNTKNKGFGYANNLGLKRAEGEFILFLNSDTKIKDNLLKEMLAWMKKHEKAGVTSCSLLNADGSLQGTGGYFPSLIRVFSWLTIQDLPFVDNYIKPFHPMKEKSPFKKFERDDFYETKKQLDWVTGAFLLTRKKVLDEVGYFDEKYFMYTEEVDLCYRIKKAGWQVWYLPDWSILHLGGASSTREFSVLNEYKGVKRFYKKFYPAWQYLVLRLFLKIGALLRMIVLGIIEGRETYKTYAKAFRLA